MRCRKAKAKIESADWTGPELAAHLEVCESCAKLAQAQKLLDSAMNSIKQEAVEPGDISVLKASLAARQATKERSIMSKISSALAGHKPLSFGLGFGILVILFLTLVPLPYQRISGYSVSFADVEGVVPADQMSKVMSAVGYENVPVKVEAGQKGVYYEFQELKSLQEAREVASAFVEYTKTKSSPWIKANIETISASLYAQARDKRIRVEIDATGKTDEQIKAEIKSKLAAQGYTEPVIYLKTDSTGKREIRLDIKGSGYSITPKQQIEIDAKGKTDAQIKAEIESKLAAQGHPNAEVKIESEKADSTRKIEIRIENPDTAGH
jgi:hypothetical protein